MGRDPPSSSADATNHGALITVTSTHHTLSLEVALVKLVRSKRIQNDSQLHLDLALGCVNRQTFARFPCLPIFALGCQAPALRLFRLQFTYSLRFPLYSLRTRTWDLHQLRKALEPGNFPSAEGLCFPLIAGLHAEQLFVTRAVVLERRGGLCRAPDRSWPAEYLEIQHSLGRVC